MEELKHAIFITQPSFHDRVMPSAGVKCTYCMIIAAIPARIGAATEQPDICKAVSVKSKGTFYPLTAPPQFKFPAKATLSSEEFPAAMHASAIAPAFDASKRFQDAKMRLELIIKAGKHSQVPSFAIEHPYEYLEMDRQEFDELNVIREGFEPKDTIAKITWNSIREKARIVYLKTNVHECVANHLCRHVVVLSLQLNSAIACSCQTINRDHGRTALDL